MRLIVRQYKKEKDVNKNVNLLIKKDCWIFISMYQKLSEEFIEKYKDKVDWCWISLHQKLSEKFIEKYQDKVWVVFDFQTSKNLPRI